MTLMLSVWYGWPFYLAAVVLAMLLRGLLWLLGRACVGRPRRVVMRLSEPLRGARGLLVWGPLIFLLPCLVVDYAVHAQRQAEIRDNIARSTRIVVRSPAAWPGEPALFESTDTALIQQLAESLRASYTISVVGFHCMCRGDLRFVFEDENGPRFTFSLHHRTRVRGFGGYGDEDLAPEAVELLDQLIADERLLERVEELNEERRKEAERQREERRGKTGTSSPPS